jgi:hypothetical protein
MFTCTSGIFAQADMQETIGMIKKNLTDSKEKIKNYEWIETTTTFYNLFFLCITGERPVIISFV